MTSFDHAKRCAFAGGRFEISRCGPIREPVWEADIASAYPYQIYGLPCLKCGKWTHLTKPVGNRVYSAQLALCRVAWDHRGSWGPLLFRNSDGTIIWPLKSEGGTWCWRPEFLAACESGTQVDLREAWVYETSCDHQPFKMVGDWYRQRIAWGKAGRGLVLKLGLNALYGTMAQSVGSRRYRSMVWAGNITSGTRAMLARAIQKIGPERVFMLATDAVYCVGDKPELEPPVDTGTFGLKDEKGEPKSALGEWELQHFDAGMFVIRPGIYFDMSGEKLRSRGFNKSTLKKTIDRILEQWERCGPKEPIKVVEKRFLGIKSGVCQAGDGPTRREDFCRWYDHEMAVDFDPRPKRAFRTPEHEILPWPCPPARRARSVPYDKEVVDRSSEGRSLIAARELADDQPDHPDTYE